MSLSVDVFRLDAGGEVEVLDVPPGCSDLAGFERWRRTVWGSDAAHRATSIPGAGVLIW